MKICSVLQVVLLMAANSLYADTAKFTALVLDYDTGKPIPGVTVRANFTKNIGWRAWSDSAKPDVDIKETDNDGRCRLSGKTNCGEACCWVPEPPQGYYSGGGWGYEYKEKNLFGVWQPDSLVATIRLQRVVNPIPLCVKKAKGEFRRKRQEDYYLLIGEDNPSMYAKTNDVASVTNARLAYDFMRHDWLPPFGDGKISDLLFTFNEETVGWDKGVGYRGVSLMRMYRMKMEVAFPGEGNGMAEILVDNLAGIKIRNAPLKGYLSGSYRWKGWFGGGDGIKTDCDKDRCYAFRIRTEYDDKGNIKSALYGKIYGDFDMLDIEGVRFLYYLNPTPNDHNLEWDMKHNLCSDPGDLSQPQP